MSRLRARCPDCRTLTAVACGPDYECHACGRAFAAAIVRVDGAEPLELPYPDAGAVDEADLARALPERPIVVARSETAHAAAVAALAARHGPVVLLRASRLPEELTATNGVYVLLDADADEAALARVGELAPVLGAGVAVPSPGRLLRALGLERART